MFHVRSRLAAMNFAKWTLTINVIYMDQDIPAEQFLAPDPGPLNHFLSGMPDLMNINQEDLNLALESLLIPLKAPIPPGIFLQEAIQVNQKHNIYT